MKRFLVFTIAIALLICTTGCGNKISDVELLEKTFKNMECIESSKVVINFSLKMLGFTSGAATFEILNSKEKIYFSMSFNEEMPFLDLAGIGTMEFLIEGDDVKIRSSLMKGLEDELAEEMANSLKTQATESLELAGLFLSDDDLASFTLVANPEDFKSKKYRSYEKDWDNKAIEKLLTEEIKKLFIENLDSGDDDVDPEEAVNEFDKVFAEMNVTMDSLLVVDTETQFLRFLKANIHFNLPIPSDSDSEWLPESINASLEFVIDYLEINTELDFPEFD